jgi:hypothetical protein
VCADAARLTEDWAGSNALVGALADCKAMPNSAQHLRKAQHRGAMLAWSTP